jgi:serine kinase of HPr protein (carbohydrate metabolism regulator)
MMLNSALMIMFTLATAGKGTLLFHAAVVSQEGKGYLFLGPSGTGKSTHAQLWLKHIDGTELVNDDNPVVRDGVVYGSPWSGKTPCYRNVSVPIGGIVMLSQAPYNKIRRLKGIEAYVAVVESVGSKVWDNRIAEGQHQTENDLASTIPMWHLECLPDEEAARLCHDTIKR